MSASYNQATYPEVSLDRNTESVTNLSALDNEVWIAM